jgi:hypothetical protein
MLAQFWLKKFVPKNALSSLWLCVSFLPQFILPAQPEPQSGPDYRQQAHRKEDGSEPAEIDHGNAVRQLLAITQASEGPDADMTETVKPLEKWTGVEVR